MYQSDDAEKMGDFRIASKFIMERLSHMFGLELIRAMYASSWVKTNPSVHDFVFRLDILTRLTPFKSLTLVNEYGDKRCGTSKAPSEWQSSFNMELLLSTINLFAPETWNHSEYDGLYIFPDKNMVLYT
jgi:hypothetical protein